MKTSDDDLDCCSAASSGSLSCADANALKSISEGWVVWMASIRERASATGLLTPSMCRISLVNWDMKSSCRTCLGVCCVEVEVRANVSGL